MWLLHTKLLKLEFFQGSDIPKYAILSHRWQDEEVTFDDMAAGHDVYSKKKGWQKIIGCCKLANKDNIEYIWVDTCCIDKRSSAELSEAINSMYDWYKSAAVCYAYLFDVQRVEELGESSWFRRSWTLQELLAPATVIFFDTRWRSIGDKDSLQDHISSITSIPRSALRRLNIDEHSIAQRMSWAAKREATRIEDLAYSLLGIFDVSMPLIYGEGEKAFQRLQEEVMRNSNDLSVFAWSGDFSNPRNGMLARCPEAFLMLGACDTLLLDEGYSTNNAGITIALYLDPLYLDRRNNAIYEAHLHQSRYVTGCVRIILCLVMPGDSPTYCRVSSPMSCAPSACTLSLHSKTNGRTKLLISKKTSSWESEPDTTCFSIHCPANTQVYIRGFWGIGGYSGTSRWIIQEPPGSTYLRCLVPARRSVGIAGYLVWTGEKWNEINGISKNTYCLCFGLDTDLQLICLAFHCPVSHSKNPLRNISAQTIMDCVTRLQNDDSNEKLHYSSDLKFCAGRLKLANISASHTLHMEYLNMTIWMGFRMDGDIELRVFNEYTRTISPDTVPLPETTIEDLHRVREFFNNAWLSMSKG